MMKRAVLVASASRGATACRHDADCSLLGVCVGGVCECDLGWTGVDCAQADLEPFSDGDGYHNKSMASWGGRALRDEGGVWHLFAAEMALGCPLKLWQSNSLVSRAVSHSGPTGPFTKVDEVLPVFHHNPTIAGPTPDGYYLLFFIGADGPETAIDCRNGLPSSGCAQPPYYRPECKPESGDATSMAWSRSLEGPWQHRVVLPRNHDGNLSRWDCRASNPAPLLLPNGTVVLVYRANACDVNGEEYLGVAVAAHWGADFVRRDVPLIGPEDGFGNNEDPFFWVDRRGHFHIVAHQQSTGNVCGDGTVDGDKAAGHTCGAHLFSRDLQRWSVSKTPVYNETVALANGSLAAFTTRQRPQLLFDSDGAPMVLYNGASFEVDDGDRILLTHTFAFGFKRRDVVVNDGDAALVV